MDRSGGVMQACAAPASSRLAALHLGIFAKMKQLFKRMLVSSWS
jgi:hypothetical protein